MEPRALPLPLKADTSASGSAALPEQLPLRNHALHRRDGVVTGGAVAEVVGQKLRALGAQRQVLCVTHLPQVAAQGHHHFQVSKAVNGSSTHSAVSRLNDKARIEELARMLGGVEITRETRANARQMLTRAQA